MANQAIALAARAPQADIMGGAIRNNAAMINMMMQQRAAERQAAQATQTMQIQAAQEERAQRLAGPQFDKATSEANSARLKYITDFFDVSALAISKVRDPQQAAAVGERLKSMFPEAPLVQSVDETLASIPKDPAKFEEWRQDALTRTMDAKDQLAQEFTTQNLGTSTRVIATPKYGTGNARVVPGSEAAVTLKPTVMNVEGIGAVVVDPNTGQAFPAAAGPTGGYSAPGLVTGPRGGGTVAGALQTNPGAIKDGGFARSQPGYTGGKGGFATFDTPQAGIAAQERLLTDNYVNKGFNTIDKIVNKYAPQGPENSAASVGNYKKYIAQRTGIDVNAPISASQVPSVAAAMREFETGQRPGGGGGQPPQTTQQAASEAERRKTADDFQRITGVDFTTGVDPVHALIKASTSGKIESVGADILAAIPENWGGGATSGMNNIQALKVVKSSLLKALAPGGRLSTGVSDEDRRSMEAQLANIDDANVPASARLRAWMEVLRIMRTNAGVSAAPRSAPRAQSPKGGANIDALLKKYGG